MTDRPRPSMNGAFGDAAALGLHPVRERGYGSRADDSADTRARAAGRRTIWPNAVCASELSADAGSVDFLWEGCLARGHLTLLSALMKSGKSTLLGHLLRALQAGDPFLGLPTRWCSTLIVSEESPAIWHRRREALGLSDQLSVMCRPMLAKPSFADWVEFVAHVANQAAHRGCDLVVFDTVSAVAPWKNENDAAEVMGTITPLTRLTRAGLAVLLVHHIGKAGGTQGRAARGSTALAGAADVLLELRRFRPNSPWDRRRVLTGLGRFDEVPTEVVMELAVDGREYLVTGDGQDDPVRDLIAEIRDVLPASRPGLTAEEVHGQLRQPGRPKVAAVRSALRGGAEGGSWQSAGAGKPLDPWRFWRSDA